MTDVPTREAWLDAAIDLLRPWFDAEDHPVPERVRAAVAFPSRAALAVKKRRIGECWFAESSGDDTYEIMVSPLLDDPVEVLQVLTHELAHAALPKDVKHKGPFARLVRSLGLEGKPTATVAGPVFRERIADVIAYLGPLPHARLTPIAEVRKPQQCRLLRTECPTCGYLARVTKRWLDSSGAPVCPADGARLVAEEVEDAT